MKPTAEHAKLAGLLQPGQRQRQNPRRLSAGQRHGPADLRSVAGAIQGSGRDDHTIRNTGGTDHLSFDAVGLPGFQFIQDPLEYSTRTHHSNMDVYDHIQPGDLMQASAIMASFVYNTATGPRCCRASRCRSLSGQREPCRTFRTPRPAASRWRWTAMCPKATAPFRPRSSCMEAASARATSRPACRRARCAHGGRLRLVHDQLSYGSAVPVSGARSRMSRPRFAM